MPKLMNQSTSLVARTVSNFGFSGKRAEELTESEYTLADIEMDLSPSTTPFVKELGQALRSIVESLSKSPRAENMLVRVQTFSEQLTETHGFVNLKEINPDDYNLDCTGGGTALYDATVAGVEAVGEYGRNLDSMDFAVNGVLFVVTDGEENSSTKVRTPAKIKTAIEEVRYAEKLESFKTILIGVGDSTRTQQYLDKLHQEAGFDQFVWVGDANPKNLAKLADFISRSVSSSSQSLGTGGASANLTF